MTATAPQAEATACRVLLVDDDALSLELTALLLAANGAQVERALGGEQALDRLRSLTAALPDVILVDRQMPGISGADVARFVQTMAQPRPRIIAMSAAPLPAAEQAIFDSALLKPLDREQLRVAVSRDQQPGDRSPSDNAPQPAIAAALDQGRLRKLREVMPAPEIAELYTIYVADTRDRIAELERCSEAGDHEGLRRCAHAIKGSSAMIGASGIASMAAGLESGEKTQQEYSKLFLEMRNGCDDVERSIAGGVASGEK
jgi:CheY-like chemotaxis protein